jgi:hypothetical protein
MWSLFEGDERSGAWFTRRPKSLLGDDVAATTRDFELIGELEPRIDARGAVSEPTLSATLSHLTARNAPL